MTLRDLINQVTDNDSESGVLDYELHTLDQFRLGWEDIKDVKVNHDKEVILIQRINQ